MPLNKYLEFKKFTESLVTQSGKILLDHQTKAQIVKNKDLKDIATTADLASEDYIINRILKEYPDHGIISEERGVINDKAKFKWVIDPLDGTKEYIRQIPLWNCSVALQFDNETVVAAVYRPQEGTIYSAALGLGSYKNSVRIKVSTEKELDHSFVYCYLPSFKRQKDKYEWAFMKLQELGKKVYRLRSLCDINTAFCWLAQGGYEAYINLSNPEKIHDIAPGLFIAREAGAYNAVDKTPLIVTANKLIYNQIEKIIYG